MLTLTLYELSDILSEISMATIATNFEGVVEVRSATSNLHTFKFESKKILPDILMFDLDHNNMDDNIVSTVLDILECYTEHYPMVIMTHSGAAELFSGKYSQLADILNDNVCLVCKPITYVKLSKCVMKRLVKLTNNNEVK